MGHDDIGADAVATWLLGLEPREVVTLAHMHSAIAQAWACNAEANAEVVITGERVAHILESHPEMAGSVGLLRHAVLDPDEVHRNKGDPAIAILYRAAESGYWLRATVLIQVGAGWRQHSVVSFRMAGRREVQGGRDRGRVVWRK